jgi:hypothetical protein
MTKEEQNQIIKDAWVKGLQKEKDIPSDVGEIYKNWLLGKIQDASAQLNQGAGQQEQMNQEQGGQENGGTQNN